MGDEDEEAIIERKRKERAELLAKLKDGTHAPAPEPERPLTPPEVKIAKAIKNELRSDLVAQQFGQIEKQLEESVGHKLENHRDKDKVGRNRRFEHLPHHRPQTR